MKNKRRFQAGVESLEGKALLSNFPILTQNAFNNALKQIDRAAGTFAKNHNQNAFLQSLSQISSKIPFGRAELLPTWQDDVGIYDPGTPGSGVAMVQQLKADLKDYVKSSVAAGSFGFKGSGSTVVMASASGVGLVPTLTGKTYQNALKQIDRAAGTFAKNHNARAFEVSLSQISSKIPYGRSDLLPTWQDDAGIYGPGTPGSGVAMVQQLKADLKDYVQTAIASGSIRYRG